MSKFPIHIDSELSCSIQSVVPLALVKKHLKVQHDLDNDYIEMLISNAFDIAQQFTGARFLKSIAYFNANKLYSTIRIHDDVFSIESITYKDLNDETKYIDLDHVELTYINQNETYFTINPIPLFTEGVDSVRVMYQRNSTVLAECDLPGTVKQAILLMVGEFYEYREDRVWNLPKASERLLRPFIDYTF